jgi:hypothetical protein
VDTFPPKSGANGKVLLCVGVGAAVELLWFGFMYPRYPRTIVAACIEALVPVAAAGYLYMSMRGMLWLADQTWSLRARRAVALVLIIGAAAVMFGMIYAAEIFHSGEFG